MSATSVGEIGLDLVVNQKQFNQQMGGLQNTAKKAGKLMAAAFATKELINFSKECINLGSDLGEVQNVVDVTFSTMKNDVNAFAKSAIGDFGISETMAKRFTGTFGAMSKAFGFSEKEAYKMGTTLTGLAGDVASFYNISQDEAYTKLKSVFTGETESLKDLGVVMTQTALDSYALANGFGKTTKAMSEAEKVSLRYAFVQNQLSAAAGDFSRTSDSWANQVRVLKLQFDSFKASIGQGLINLLTPVLQVINAIIAKLSVLADKFKSFTEMLTGKKSSEGSPGLIEDANAITESVAGIGEAAKKSVQQVKQLAGFDELNNLSSASGSGTEGGSVGGTSLLGDASSAEKAADKTVSAMDKIKNKGRELMKSLGLDTFFGEIKKNTEETFKNLYSSAESVYTNLKSTATKNAEEITKSVTNIMTNVVKTTIDVTTIFSEMWLEVSRSIKKFTNTYKDEIDTFLFGISNSVIEFTEMCTSTVADAFSTTRKWWEKDGKSVWTEVLDTIGSIAGSILLFWNTVIQPVIDDMSEKLRVFWTEHLQSLLVKMLNFFTSVGKSFSKTWSKIKPAVDFIVKYAGPIISKFLKDIGEKTLLFFGIVTDTTGGITTSLTGLTDFVTGVFTGDWTLALQGAEEIFQGTFDSIVATVDGTIASIAGKEKWNQVKKSFADGVDSVKEPWRTLSNWFEENVTTPIENVFEGAKERISQIFDGLWIIAKAIWEVASGWFKENVIDPLVEKFSPITDKISTYFSSAYKKVKDTWTNAKQWFEEHVTSKLEKPFQETTNKIGGYFGNLWKSIKQGAVSAMNSAIAGIEKGINAIVSGINKIIGGFNGVVTWASKVTNEKWGGVSLVPKVALSRISQYQGGGYPNRASLFWANENGVPELVGTMGGKTAVASGTEITGIKDAIYTAGQQESMLMQTMISLLTIIAEKEFGITDDQIGKSAQRYARDYYNRTGNEPYVF